MNERIKELAEHAEMNATLLFNKDKLEKFAELIVRECADLFVNSQYVNTKSEYYEGFNEALVYAGNKIKKHFGIEQ